MTKNYASRVIYLVDTNPHPLADPGEVVGELDLYVVTTLLSSQRPLQT